MTARWYRGNLHTHTTNSDGDSPPDVVVSWYRDAGYDFLVVTDHDVLTDPAGLRDAAGPMTLIPGEGDAIGRHPRQRAGHRDAASAGVRGHGRGHHQSNVDNVRAQGGCHRSSHPNFRWRVRPEDLAALHDVRLFRITTRARRSTAWAVGQGSRPWRRPGTRSSAPTIGCSASPWTTPTTSGLGPPVLEPRSCLDDGAG
ncbi:MAG: hypothetical protein R3C32_00265 [Chloroflexota bacterium]